MIVKFFWSFGCLSLVCNYTLANDVTLRGEKVPQPPGQNCSAFKPLNGQPNNDPFVMSCPSADTDLLLKGKPNKNFTQSFFCSPESGLALYHWEDIKDSNGYYNVTECKPGQIQWWLGVSQLELHCQQELFNKPVKCNNGNAKSKQSRRGPEVFSGASSSTPALVSPASTPTSTTLTALLKTETLTTTSFDKRLIDNKDNVWMFLFIGLVIVIVLVISGYLIYRFVCYYRRPKHETDNSKQGYKNVATEEKYVKDSLVHDSIPTSVTNDYGNNPQS